MTKDVQLREIPRMGVDAEPFLHVLLGAERTIVPGIRLAASRGFYGARPYAAVQVPLGQIWNAFTVFVVPVSVVIGGEYEAHMGRLTATPYAGVGASYLYVSEAITGLSDETNLFPHIGAQAYVNLSYLVTRNMRIYADVGGEYWLAIHSFFSNYYGLGAGAGVAFKL